MPDAAKDYDSRVALFEKECARLRRDGGAPGGVVFLGDGLVERYRGPLQWVNRGVASDRLHHPERNVFERIGSDRTHPNPLAIVTLLGIHDVEDAPDAIGEHVSAYRHLLTNLRQIHPHARLAVCSLLPTRAGRRHLNASVDKLNAELAELAQAQGAVYWNLHDELLDASRSEADPALVRGDGVRLSREGYAKMTAFMERHASDLVAPGASGGAVLRRWSGREELARAWGWVRPALGKLAPEPPADESGMIHLDAAKLGARVLETYGKDAWSHKAETDSDESLVRAHLVPEIEFFCRFAATRSPLFRDLYLGSRASFFARNKALWSGQPGGLRAALEKDRGLWLEFLADAPSSDREAVTRAFDDLLAAVVVPSPKTVKLLFVGDCLLEDVELLLGGRLVRQGLLAKIDFVLTRNPVEQIRQIKEASQGKIDGVVYSPLSWQFDPEFESILRPSLRSPQAIKKDIDDIWGRVSSTVKLLAKTFECPIYVHNTAAAVRASDDLRRAVRSLVTYPTRSYARRELAGRIGALVSEINKTTFQHLVLIDELSAVKDLRDDLTLGKVLYYADAIHPAALSNEVAHRLASYVVAAARFVGKKVVVCDLDNTLWDGVIGEGLGVRHQKGRQKILALLKQKGVVLAINSKNDPANVKWEDSVLSAGDFVASEISWGAKAAGMKKIQDALNLKIKDFVFIDDRSDERAMIAEEYPDLIAMDPCAESTWTIFRAWAELLGADEGDRTQLYRERAERERLLGGEQPEEAMAAELFSKLSLRIDIRRSTPEDLKRIHELINRTNQWNLVGSRCTFNEVEEWHRSPQHIIYTAQVSDKFGDMGLICCCVADVEEDALSVRAFVLSCRVFGYGVETLMLDRLKKEAERRFGVPRVRGRYLENAHNKPCKRMYPSHGFVEVDGTWISPGGKVTAPDPVWFSV